MQENIEISIEELKNIVCVKCSYFKPDKIEDSCAALETISELITSRKLSLDEVKKLS